jgi:hypothetical protein
MPTLDTSYYYVIKNIFSPLRALTNVGGGSSVQLTPGPPTTFAQLWTELWAFESGSTWGGVAENYYIKSVQGGARPYLGMQMGWSGPWLGGTKVTDGSVGMYPHQEATYWTLSFLNTPGDPVASVTALSNLTDLANTYALTFGTSGPTMNYVKTQPNIGFGLNFWQFSKTAIPLGSTSWGHLAGWV